jgi:hypothetical protein
MLMQLKLISQRPASEAPKNKRQIPSTNIQGRKSSTYGAKSLQLDQIRSILEQQQHQRFARAGRLAICLVCTPRSSPAPRLPRPIPSPASHPPKPRPTAPPSLRSLAATTMIRNKDPTTTIQQQRSSNNDSASNRRQKNEATRGTSLTGGEQEETGRETVQPRSPHSFPDT